MRFNSLYPELLVADIARSLRFYVEVLGFRLEYDRPEEKFAFLSYQGAQLMLLQDNENQHSRTGPLEYPRGQGVNFSIVSRSVAPVEKSLEAVGHPLRIPVREQWHRVGESLHGERQLWVMDPDGYLLRFVEDLGEKPVSASATNTEMSAKAAEAAEHVELAGCVVIDDQRRLLLLHRISPCEQWEVPGGKVENGEDHISAALRECLEELGVQLAIVRSIGTESFKEGGRLFRYTWFQARIENGCPKALDPRYDRAEFVPLIELGQLSKCSAGLCTLIEKFDLKLLVDNRSRV